MMPDRDYSAETDGSFQMAQRYLSAELIYHNQTTVVMRVYGGMKCVGRTSPSIIWQYSDIRLSPLLEFVKETCHAHHVGQGY